MNKEEEEEEEGVSIFYLSSNLIERYSLHLILVVYLIKLKKIILIKLFSYLLIFLIYV